MAVEFLSVQDFFVEALSTSPSLRVYPSEIVTLFVPSDAAETVTVFPLTFSPSVEVTPLTVANVFEDFLE